MQAKLVSKVGLKELELHWGHEHSDVLDGTIELSDVLDGLQPPPNLLSLVIKNQGGSVGPGWLCGDITLVMLKSLHLEGVSWVSPPTFGKLAHLESLTLIRVSGLGQIRPGFGGVTDKSFIHLKEIQLDNLPEFTEWVGAPNSLLFSRLERVRCRDCPNLCVLPFLQECSAGCYTSMLTLEIIRCPKLFLPAMPPTSTVTHIIVPDSPPSGSTGAFQAGSKITWALPMLTSLKSLMIVGEPSFLSVSLLSNLTSLTSLQLVHCKNLIADGFNPLIAAVSLKDFNVHNTGIDGPHSIAADLFSELAVASRAKLLLPSAGCFHLKSLMVDSISAVLAAPVCNLLATTLQNLIFHSDPRVESFTEEEESALQLLTSLGQLSFWDCPGLPSLPQGLQSLSSLFFLSVHECAQIQSLPMWEGLPTCLEQLRVIHCPEIRSLPIGRIPTSLRDVTVIDCSPELNEHAEKLQAKGPDWLKVTLNF
jgi:hypothetical protein